MEKINGKGEFSGQEVRAGRFEGDDSPQAVGTEDEVTGEWNAAEADDQSAGQELERLTSERDVLLDRMARLQAEFENYRKRQTREQQDFREYALAEALKSLLPTLDSFERALSVSGSSDEFRSGVELIYRQMQGTLARLGVEPIAAQGEQFDPKRHEAVQMVDTNEAEDNRVLEELQRGYRLKDRLLRPAMVRVARNPGR